MPRKGGKVVFTARRSDKSEAVARQIKALGDYAGIDAVPALSREYPEARIVFSGFSANALDRFARLGGDPARVYVESRPRTTSEDALYSAALLKPKPSERWRLVTLASHMPRAVGCFRVAGFEVVP